MKKKVYVEMDSVLGKIEFPELKLGWTVNPFDWMDFEELMLTEKQILEATEEDFCGYISYERFTEAKMLYESINN